MPDIIEDLETYRLVKGLTQEQIAALLGVSTRTYQSIIKSGQIKRVELLKAAHKLMGTQNIAPETYLEKRRNQKNHFTPHLVPLLPVKAYAGYVKSYDQTDFLETLDMYALPPGINPVGAVWRYFEVGGSSMEPTFFSGEIILGSQVPYEDWRQLRNFYTYIIITSGHVLIKRIYMKNPEEWVLISDNEKQYPQQLLKVSEVKELWVFRRHIDSNAKPPKEFKIKI